MSERTYAERESSPPLPPHASDDLRDAHDALLQELADSRPPRWRWRGPEGAAEHHGMIRTRARVHRAMTNDPSWDRAGQARERRRRQLLGLDQLGARLLERDASAAELTDDAAEPAAVPIVLEVSGLDANPPRALPPPDAVEHIDDLIAAPGAPQLLAA